MRRQPQQHPHSSSRPSAAPLLRWLLTNMDCSVSVAHAVALRIDRSGLGKPRHGRLGVPVAPAAAERPPAPGACVPLAMGGLTPGASGSDACTRAYCAAGGRLIKQKKTVEKGVVMMLTIGRKRKTKKTETTKGRSTWRGGSGRWGVGGKAHRTLTGGETWQAHAV